MRADFALLLRRLVLPALSVLAGCTEPPRPAREEPRVPAPVILAPATNSAAADTVPPAAADTAAALLLRFLDVGQGDAVLLQSQGRSALIDTGPSDRVVERLRALGVDTLHLLVASHNHADHIGGADAVLDSLPVLFYLDNGKPATTRIQERVLHRVELRSVTYLEPRHRTLTLGAARLRVVPPPQSTPGEEQNNHSLAILVELGRFRALLTGDSEVEEISAWLAKDSIPDVDVLKAAHHGSRNGVSPVWLARTRPEVVVISTGAENSYGHPHAAALRYYCAGDRRIIRTDRSGEVLVRVGAGGSYRIREQRPTDPARACSAPPRPRGDQRDRP